MLIIVHASFLIDDITGASRRDLVMRSLSVRNSTRFPFSAVHQAMCIHMLCLALQTISRASASNLGQFKRIGDPAKELVINRHH